MASQYSILRQYTPYVSPYNIDLIKDVSMYKQQKVDAAREKMYTQIDYLMGQEIDKPEARAYMEDKMSNVIANINEKYRGVDLSSEGITRAIQGEISTVLDDTVINAIAGTKEGKRMRSEIESIRQNHPELYSPINEWYAMNPYYQWRADGKAGSRLGSLHYSPYIDYNKEMNKIVSDFRKNNKGKKIQTTEYDVDGNPTGGIIETNVDDLTDVEIQNLVSANLSENMRNQMRIEASYMAATNPVFQNQAMVNEYLTSHIKRYDRYIGALNAKKASVGDNKALTDLLNSQIQETKNRKADVKRDIDMIIKTGDPVAAANFVVSSNLFDKMSDAWRYDNTSYERKKDELYFARMEEDRKQKKFLADNALAMAKAEQIRLETEYMRQNGKKMATDGKSGSKSSSSGSDSGVMPEEVMGPAITNAGTGKTGSFDLANVPFEQLTAASQARKENILKLYNSLSEKDRSDILAAADEDAKKTPGLYGGMSDEEKVYSYLRDNGGQKNAYLCRGNNRLSEAYNAALATEGKINSATRAIDGLSDMMIQNIASDENMEKILVPDSADDIDKKLILLASAALSDKRKFSGVSLYDYHPVLGAFWRGNRGWFTTPISSSTATLALINAMKKVSGDQDFNVYEYMEIGDDGKIKLKEKVSDDEPYSIAILRAMNKVDKISSIFASIIEEDINLSIDNDAVSDYLSTNHNFDTYLNYTWNADSTKDPLEKAQIQQLSGILAGKIKGLDPTAIKSITMNTEKDGDTYRRYLTAVIKKGEDTTTTERIEVTDDEFKRNHFDPSISGRNYPVDSYKSNRSVCNFADTGTKEGRSYGKYLAFNDPTENKTLIRMASKEDVKNDTNSILQTFGSYLSPEDMAAMKKIADSFVDMSDNICVELEGVNDRGVREISVNFYDKRDKNSENPTLLFSDYIPLIPNKPDDDKYADYWDNIHELCPQFFYVKYMREALIERLKAMREPYVRKVAITPNNNDKFGKLSNYLSKLNSPNG